MGAWNAGMIVPIELELSDPNSCRRAVQQLRKYKFDGIILNAGVMSLSNKIIKHGMELTFLTNYFSTYILLTGLGSTGLTPTGRIVLVSSCAMFDTYDEGIYTFDITFEKHRWTPWGAFAMSKLANECFMKEFAKTLKPGQMINTCHPGICATEAVRHFPCWFQGLFFIMGQIGLLKSRQAGAATQLYLATSPQVAHISGEYWSHCNIAATSPFAEDEGLRERLMTLSATLDSISWSMSTL